MSSTRSSASSSPIENRNRPAVTPKDSSSLGGSPTCVLVAGWHTKVSGPPNDVAMCAIRSFDTKASQVSKSPSSSRRTLFRQTAFVAVQARVVRVTQEMGAALKQPWHGSRETVQW